MDNHLTNIVVYIVILEGLVALKRAGVEGGVEASGRRKLLKHVLHGYVWPIGCLLA